MIISKLPTIASDFDKNMKNFVIFTKILENSPNLSKICYHIQ
ncbi:hypothetical protein E9U_00906 [Moraxella catarrhalis BC8]|nr:hypothetical protein E9U_00906 [Moraxella catarrhalis BC8]